MRMQQGTNISTLKGWILSKANKRIPTRHTTWAYIRAWRRAAGCAMVPIRVVHSCYSTTISKGIAWERASKGLYKTPTKDSPAGIACCAKGELPTSKLGPVELPLLARSKGCFAAYYARSIDRLSGRTTGQLGYDRPDSAYAIGGTVELALGYSN